MSTNKISVDKRWTNQTISHFISTETLYLSAK
nr:MAG TPA: hypothetical protein [Caudoviricetes sp.]